MTTGALLTGGAIVGLQAFLSGCKPTAAVADELFTPEDVAFLDEVSDTIYPATGSTPGAKEAGVGEFMKTIVTDCYKESDQGIFKAGMTDIRDRCKAGFGKSFMEISPDQRLELLTAIDGEARAHSESNTDGPEHYFNMMKQLTDWGYFTSQRGATEALRYVEIPGYYQGCIPYTEGERAWAL